MSGRYLLGPPKLGVSNSIVSWPGPASRLTTLWWYEQVVPGEVYVSKNTVSFTYIVSPFWTAEAMAMNPSLLPPVPVLMESVIPWRFEKYGVPTSRSGKRRNARLCFPTPSRRTSRPPSAASIDTWMNFSDILSLAAWTNW